MSETKYSVGFKLMNGDIVSSSALEVRERYPFDEEAFNVFFQNFFKESFNFDGYFRCIYIYDAKENSPRHSYAIGWMFAEDVDELNRYLARGDLPKVIGQITFECGGGIEKPRITVEKR
jgi:hypothetical protein